MFKELEKLSVEDVSMSIGVDAIFTTASNMDVVPTEENIIEITKVAIQESGTPSHDIVLAIISSHKDVSKNKELKKLIDDLWRLL